jgi:hypothetical protein
MMSVGDVSSPTAQGQIVLRGSSAAGLALLAISWLVTRSILLAGTLSGIVPADISAYERWANLLRDGQAPAQDTAFVYPPGSLIIFLGGGSLGEFSYFRSFTILAIFADLVLLLALVAFALRSGQGSMMGAWAWVVMGFAAGPLLVERYDVFAALLGAAAVLALSRPAVTGALAGLGFLVKIWPEIAILGVPRQRMLRALGVNLVVIAVGWVLLQAIFGNSFGFVSNVLNKSVSVEAVVAYPFLVMRRLFGTFGVTGQFGSWEVTGPGVAAMGSVSTAVGLLALAFLLLLRYRGVFDHVPPGDIVLLGVLIFVATHKINSLQYGIWIAAMTAATLAYRTSRSMGPAALLILMLIVTNDVIWAQFVPFISGNTFLLVFQGLRLGLLLSAGIWMALTMRRAPSGASM